jgi:adenylate kinase family enzyme
MRVAIIGNSGSGKSTLARCLVKDQSVAVLDLDLVFWASGSIEKPAAVRASEVRKFCEEHDAWIIEGCYADLIEVTLSWRPELIFMDPGREVCLSNCRRRPFEPHKYQSREDQDQNLGFLLQWVENYYERDGLMSYRSHKALYDRYAGPKRRISEQPQAQ